jgi:integrase/recombinase XerD
MLIRFAMKEFLSEKEFENLSKNTLRGYEMLFEDFQKYCEGNGLERVDDLTSRALKSYLNYCKNEKGNNPTSINTKRKQFRAFFNFLVTEGILENNPTDNIKKVREDIRIKTFTDEEVRAVLSHLRRLRRKEDSFYGVRNHCAFMTLIGTGLRASELCSLSWNNVDLERRTLKVFGKMRKEEAVPLSERLCEELRYWKNYCIQTFGKCPQYVFINLRGERLTVNGLKCWFKRLAQKMDFPETRCSAHSCRHYFAKTWIQNGGDISTLARVLRHTSIKTTEKYLQFWGNEVAEDNDKFNPLNKL